MNFMINLMVLIIVCVRAAVARQAQRTGGLNRETVHSSPTTKGETCMFLLQKAVFLQLDYIQIIYIITIYIYFCINLKQLQKILPSF